MPNMEAESSSKPVPHSVVLQIGCKLVMMVTGPVLDQLPPPLLSPPLVSMLTHLSHLTDIQADHDMRIQQHTPKINPYEAPYSGLTLWTLSHNSSNIGTQCNKQLLVPQPSVPGDTSRILSHFDVAPRSVTK